MNEFLATLLKAVIIAAVPVLVAYFGKAVRSAAQYLGEKSENAMAKKYLSEAADAITTAVTFTSQTYVDALKKSGEFTKENPEWALKVALAQAQRMLTEEAKEFLSEAYGDLSQYLEGRIEAEVRRQKLDQPATLALPIVSETATDATAIAASTAAATAASVAQTAISQMSAEILPGTPLE